MISYLCCVYTPIDFQVTTIPHTHRHAECLCEAIWWRHDTDILQQRRAGTCLASWPREHQLAWGLAGKWSAVFSNVNDLPRYRNYTCFVSLLCLINGLGVSLDVCKDLMHLYTFSCSLRWRVKEAYWVLLPLMTSPTRPTAAPHQVCIKTKVKVNMKSKWTPFTFTSTFLSSITCHILHKILTIYILQFKVWGL